ncbi:hypothetical protein AB0N07_05715 [Streptomyces sp. NPDC051172]|uniref:hypothetical protein n=1 Tax=Streptomyces sp. NPDC051172 TaxID=3155796 RepID=UPI003435D469
MWGGHDADRPRLLAGAHRARHPAHPRHRCVGPDSTVGAAKKSLLRALTAELGGKGPRIHELVTGPIRTRPRAAMGADSPSRLSAEDLGHHAGQLIAGRGPWTAEPGKPVVTVGAQPGDSDMCS